MDLEKYKKIFVQEASKYLDELDIALIKAEKDFSNLEIWGEIHGKMHSMKGMAKALSMEKISGLCHSMEEWCKHFQGGI
jgi:two-component system chemotaxis sensor kinase CheA